MCLLPPKRRPGCLIIRYPGKIKGGIWVKLEVIWGENSRKPVFGFQLSKEGLFCKGLSLTFVEYLFVLAFAPQLFGEDEDDAFFRAFAFAYGFVSPLLYGLQDFSD